MVCGVTSTFGDRAASFNRRGPPEAGGLPNGPICQTGHFGEVGRSGAHLFISICRRLIHLEGTDALGSNYTPKSGNLPESLIRNITLRCDVFVYPDFLFRNSLSHSMTSSWLR